MGIITLQFFYSSKKIEFRGYKYPLNYSTKEFRIFFIFNIFSTYIFRVYLSKKNIIVFFSL